MKHAFLITVLALCKIAGAQDFSADCSKFGNAQSFLSYSGMVKGRDKEILSLI